MDLFVLSNAEMLYLGYPMDRAGHHYAEKESSHNTVWFLDCEMIHTTLGTEVVVIGFGKQNHDLTWEKHILKIKPKGDVIDYITPITGLDHLSVFDMTQEEGMSFLLQRLNKNDFIVGHHLYNDLRALKLYHEKVIDCCMVFHHPDAPPYYYSLKDLSATYLKRIIQNGAHDPTEDGIASYDLIKWCVDQGYVKTVWKNLGQKYIPSVNHVVQGLGIPEESIRCLYSRNIEIVGTCKPEIDYDLLAICDQGKMMNGTGTIIMNGTDTIIMNGSVIRYGNIGISYYSVGCFEQMLRDQIIWAVESIYCPDVQIYIEKTNYRMFYEQYRTLDLVKSNEMLKQSVCYEASRKMAMAKKQFRQGNVKESKKYVFMGMRIVEYARQIVMTNKIHDIKAVDYIWDMLDNQSQNFNNYNEFKILWHDLYIRMHREFTSFVPKKETYQCLYKNPIMHMLRVIQDSEEKDFCVHYPEYQKPISELMTMCDTFIRSMKKMHHDTIQLCKSRKDYAQYIQKYPRVYHKYLFGMYDGTDLNLLIANQKTKRLYVDLFLKETKLRTINNYGYTPENQYGKYAPDVALWEQEQIEKAKHIVTNDQIDVNKIRYVGGLDISFDPMDDTKGVGYITIYDLIDKKIVYEDHKKATLCVPYISGFLGFREVTEYMEILKKVKNDKPEYFPDVLMIDGFGILHHRGFGSASHIGYESQIPTIGVAKTLLYIDGLNEQTVKEKFRQECKKTGDYVDLIGESGTLYGVGYKSTSESLKPIYISVGHNISLESCIKIVNMCTKYRIPEPIRNSDIKSKLFM